MSVSRRAVVLFVGCSCLAAPATPARGQLIQVKTLPLAQGNQFQIFPSANLGMGSVSIALADSVFDPFVNPATGSRIQASRFFGSPTVYTISQGTGGGRSLPLALLARRANWYGGLALAVQQVDPSRAPQSGGGVIVDLPPPGGGGPFGPGSIPVQSENEAHGNQFAFASLGRILPDKHLSIGASVLWNGLHAVDGVDLLYANSRRIEQSGDAVDLRVGALKEWPGDSGKAPRSLQAILLHNRFAATHTVTYADAIWNPITQQFDQQDRLEENHEQTNTWGLQLNYQIPVDTVWRIGWLATVNRASHPKIPTYELTNVPAIPRDPGYTHAFNLGIGISKVDGAERYGLELVYEPISSYTWADAAAPTATAGGDTIATGGRTIENRFRFNNAWFRLGIEDAFAEGKPTRFQLGLIVHPIQYQLEQHDHVQELSRKVSASWLEWTPTWGLSYRREGLELRYQGRVTKGAGRPGTQQFGFGVLDRAVAAPGGTILAAPTGPLFMTDVSTVTHQISLSLPLR